MSLQKIQSIDNINLSSLSYDQTKELAEKVSRTSFCPSAYRGKPDEILICWIFGSNLGLSLFASLNNIAVINGKPCIYGDALLALVLSNKLCEYVEETYNEVKKEWRCRAKRKNSPYEVVSTFSVADAQKAGLIGKSGPWTTYPKRMLQMRARGFALRDAFPDILHGIITREEAEDYAVDARPLGMQIVEEDAPVGVIAAQQILDVTSAKLSLSACSSLSELKDVYTGLIIEARKCGLDEAGIAELTEVKDRVKSELSAAIDAGELGQKNHEVNDLLLAAIALENTQQTQGASHD